MLVKHETCGADIDRMSEFDRAKLRLVVDREERTIELLLYPNPIKGLPYKLSYPSSLIVTSY